MSELYVLSGPKVQGICLDNRPIPSAHSLKGGTAVSLGGWYDHEWLARKSFFWESYKEWQIPSHRDAEYFKTACSNQKNSFRPFLNLTVAFQAVWFFVVGAVPCIIECLAASLASYPLDARSTLPLIVTTKHVPRQCQMSLVGQFIPNWETPF